MGVPCLLFNRSQGELLTRTGSAWTLEPRLYYILVPKLYMSGNLDTEIPRFFCSGSGGGGKGGCNLCTEFFIFTQLHCLPAEQCANSMFKIKR